MITKKLFDKVSDMVEAVVSSLKSTETKIAVPEADSTPSTSVTELRSKLFSFQNSFTLNSGDGDPLKRTFKLRDISYHLRFKKIQSSEGVNIFRQKAGHQSVRILQIVADLDLIDCTQLGLLIRLDDKLRVVTVNKKLHKQYIYMGSSLIAVTYDLFPSPLIKEVLLDVCHHRTQSILHHYVK